MNRIHLLLLILLCCTPAVVGQEHSTLTPAPAGRAWTRHTSAEGRYSVLFLGQPRLTSQEATNKSGDKFTQYMAQATDDVTFLTVGYFDYPTTFSLDDAVAGMVESLKGTLVAKESISLGGHLGMQAKIEAKTEAGPVLVDRARIYDYTRRVYVLQCLNLKEGDGPALVAKCESFFDSFKVENTP